MSQRRLIVMAGVATAVLLIVAWWAARAGQATEAGRRALAGRRTELTARLQRGEAELAAAKKPAAAVVAVEESKKVAPEPPEEVSLIEQLQDPKLQVLHFAMERAFLRQRYGPFFWKEGLTPAQIDRLSDVLVRSRMNSYDLSEIHRTQGLAFNDPAMRAQRDRDKAEVEAGLRDVLGEAGYARLDDYRRSIEIREHVGKIAGAAALEGVPINREQADALVNALAATTPLFGSGGPAEFGRIDWKTAEAQAQGILSPAQMKVLREDRPMGGRSRNAEAADRAIDRATGELMKAGKLLGK